MKNEDQKMYEYWLHNLPGVGERTIEKLLKALGGAEQVYRASEKELAQTIRKTEQLEQILLFRKEWETEKEYHALLNKGIAFYTAEDSEYPKKIRSLSHPPYGIYCLGQMPPTDLEAVAIIGARECSGYGESMARAFGEAMAAAGVPVISGMARGIDGISQMAALQAGGRTWAVLGCGVDVCYPASNQQLYRKILETGGGILSVVPPGTEPIKRLFPERNRIVAGLCDLLLVIEARQKSGTWITVDMALEQGKSVYAVPGRLTDRLSDGCNMLLRQGAGIALSPEDLLAELKVLHGRNGKTVGEKHSGEKQIGEKQTGERHAEEKIGTDKENVLISQPQKENPQENLKENLNKKGGVLDFLDFYPKSAESIWEEMQAAGSRKSLQEVFHGLILACLEGKARQIAGNYFLKTFKEKERIESER